MRDLCLVFNNYHAYTTWVDLWFNVQWFNSFRKILLIGRSTTLKSLSKSGIIMFFGVSHDFSNRICIDHTYFSAYVFTSLVIFRSLRYEWSSIQIGSPPPPLFFIIYRKIYRNLSKKRGRIKDSIFFFVFWSIKTIDAKIENTCTRIYIYLINIYDGICISFGIKIRVRVNRIVIMNFNFPSHQNFSYRDIFINHCHRSIVPPFVNKPHI